MKWLLIGVFLTASGNATSVTAEFDSLRACQDGGGEVSETFRNGYGIRLAFTYVCVPKGDQE